MATVCGVRERHMDSVKASREASRSASHPASWLSQQDCPTKGAYPALDRSASARKIMSEWHSLTSPIASTAACQPRESSAYPAGASKRRGAPLFCNSPTTPLTGLASPGSSIDTWDESSPRSSSSPTSPRASSMTRSSSSSSPLSPQSACNANHGEACASPPRPLASNANNNKKRLGSGPKDSQLSLREQALLRSASGATSFSDRSPSAEPSTWTREDDMAHSATTCINGDSVATMCMAMDIAERVIEGLSILPVSESAVLYALFVAGEQLPRFPGNDRELGFLTKHMTF